MGLKRNIICKNYNKKIFSIFFLNLILYCFHFTKFLDFYLTEKDWSKLNHQ